MARRGGGWGGGQASARRVVSSAKASVARFGSPPPLTFVQQGR